MKKKNMLQDNLLEWLNLVEVAIATTKFLENNLDKKDPGSGYYEARDSYRNLIELGAMLNARIQRD